MSFSQTLVQLRRTAGFANPTEVHRQIIQSGYKSPAYSQYRRYEQGDSLPTAEGLAIIIDALGLTAGEAAQLCRSLLPQRQVAKRRRDRVS